MNIHEYQAKRLLKSSGILIPRGDVARTADAAADLARSIDSDRWVVKAQVMAGGRGLGSFEQGGSGVQMVRSIEAVRETAEAMIGNRLVTAQTGDQGLVVESVYVEKEMKADKEIGLAILVDERSRGISLIITEQGGVAIESGLSSSNNFHKLAVDASGSMDSAQLDEVLSGFRLDVDSAAGLSSTVRALGQFFCGHDATLVEINPLGLCDGKWVALDAKMAIDKNALYRQEAIRQISEVEGISARSASDHGFNHIPLDGDVACLAVGAGLSMATLDALRVCGGKPANFLDLPPDSKVNRVVSALELALSQPGVKSLIINVFGGGIMRCDTVSDAISLVNSSEGFNVPLSVRLAGTNADLANRRLRESMPEVYLAVDMEDAARYAVNAAAGMKEQPQAAVTDGLVHRLTSWFRS